MPNVYVNGHGFINLNRTDHHGHTVHTYVLNNHLYDGRETMYLVNGGQAAQATYPNRLINTYAFEVHNRHNAGAGLFEHLLVADGSQMVDFSQPVRNVPWTNRQRPPVNLANGVLHTLGNGDLVYVGDYQTVVKLGTIIQEVSAQTGGQQHQFHWTACREYIPNRHTTDIAICTYLQGHLGEANRRTLA